MRRLRRRWFGAAAGEEEDGVCREDSTLHPCVYTAPRTQTSRPLNRFRAARVEGRNDSARGEFALRPLYAVVVGVMGLAVVTAGCGGAIPSSNGGPAMLKLNGQYLVDRQGRSVYLFEKDKGGESYCSGACAAVWPPLETSTAPQAGAGIQNGALEYLVNRQGNPVEQTSGSGSSSGSSGGSNGGGGGYR